MAKLARFWVTLAMSVSVRAVRSSGYSCIRLKSDGDMMAGHRKRRKSEALIKRSLMSGRPRLLHSCRHEAKTSFSSRGKTLHKEEEALVFAFVSFGGFFPPAKAPALRPSVLHVLRSRCLS